MIKVLFYTVSDLTSFSSEEVKFVRFDEHDKGDTYYDIAVIDKDTVSVLEGIGLKLQKNIYTIVVVDDVEEASSMQPKANAWILSDKLRNIHKLIKSAADRLTLAKELHSANKVLLQVSADNDITTKSCDLILLNLKKATAQVKDIFEAQVDEMRSIHGEIRVIRAFLQDEYSPPSCSDVVSAAKQTDEILIRTDDVIKAMHGFIRILQCEDRLSQMLGGLKNLLNLENDLIREHGIELNKEQLVYMTSTLEALFSIQEQRDIAQGNCDLEKMITCGDITESEPEEFELF